MVPLTNQQQKSMTENLEYLSARQSFVLGKKSVETSSIDKRACVNWKLYNFSLFVFIRSGSKCFLKFSMHLEVFEILGRAFGWNLFTITADRRQKKLG